MDVMAGMISLELDAAPAGLSFHSSGPVAQFRPIASTPSGRGR
jgi:hypothetical protein